MRLDRLTSAYTLTPRDVSPKSLLLDPRNPRFITESVQDRTYTAQQIQLPKTQDYVRDLVCRHEHDVERLIVSIREMGFVGGLHEIVVKDVGRGGPYLVIEGNRRTAALQHLLQARQTLRPDVRASIETIQVKEFVYRKNSELTEEDVIDALLGNIHIDGPKEWGALEKAHYVHRSYLRVYGTGRAFQYDQAVARETGSTFKMSPQAVHKCLKICRVYEQLRRAGVGVEPKHYTLIDLATKSRWVAGPYFELDASQCELSVVGVERFVALVLGDPVRIHNPKLFDEFVNVFCHGTPLELSEVESGAASIEDTWAAIARRRERREFREALEKIRRGIGDLFIDDFQGTEGEKAEILRIKRLVDSRLLPLATPRTA